VSTLDADARARSHFPLPLRRELPQNRAQATQRSHPRCRRGDGLRIILNIDAASTICGAALLDASVTADGDPLDAKTGGSWRPCSDALAAKPGERITEPRPLRPPLVLGALVVWFVDLAFTRVRVFE